MDINKYQKAKIYKLVGGGKTYIGSTIQSLSKRKSQHKTNKKSLCVSFEISKGDFDIFLIEDYPCNSKKELLSRERYWVENNECINKNIPIRSLEEHKKYQKKYYLEHKFNIQEYSKNYREKNKEHLQKEKKKYYEENKERIKAINSERNKKVIKCDCGKTYTLGHKKRHLKSTYHLKHIK